MKQTLEVAGTKVQKDAQRAAPVGVSYTTGGVGLRQSITVNADWNRVEIGVLRGTASKYAAAVEFGSKPHFPPIAPIERWAKIKLGQPGLGFLIARKISQKGTKAQPYLVPAFESNVGHTKKIIEEGLQALFEIMSK